MKQGRMDGWRAVQQARNAPGSRGRWRRRVVRLGGRHCEVHWRQKAGSRLKADEGRCSLVGSLGGFVRKQGRESKGGAGEARRSRLRAGGGGGLRVLPLLDVAAAVGNQLLHQRAGFGPAGRGREQAHSEGGPAALRAALNAQASPAGLHASTVRACHARDLPPPSRPLEAVQAAAGCTTGATHPPPTARAGRRPSSGAGGRPAESRRAAAAGSAAA